MARQITLDDRELIEIVNSQGAVTGSFLFNPTDLDIIQRCEKVAEFFNNFRVPEHDDNRKALDDASAQIKEQFDYLLDTEASATLFAHSNPLSLWEDGRTYCEYVLDVIRKFVENEFHIRTEKMQNRVDKYTEKYVK